LEIVLDAFRRAQRAGKVLGIAEAFGEAWKLPSHVAAGHLGPWEDQIVAQALVVLRRRGLPEPVKSPCPAFAKMVEALNRCKEIPDDPDPQTGGKPGP
jgi:hypothetical protein